MILGWRLTFVCMSYPSPTTLSCLSRLSTVNNKKKKDTTPKTFNERLCVADSINLQSSPNIQLLFSSSVCFSVSVSLPLQQSLNVQTGLCIERCSFRLQSTDLPGYTWQCAVKQDVEFSPRHNGFVKAMLRQTDGEERTAKVEATVY